MPWNFVGDTRVSWSLYKARIRQLTKSHETQGSQTKYHGIRYINLIYIYLFLLYNSFILDIALGSPQTNKLI